MQFVVHHPADRADLHLEVIDPSATVADLVTALAAALHLGDAEVGAVAVGGRPVPAHAPLTDVGLHQAVEVRLGVPVDPPWPEAPSPPVAELEVTAGLDAGRRTPLPAGVHLVGPPGSAGRAVVALTPDGRAWVGDLGGAALDAGLEAVAPGAAIPFGGGEARLLPPAMVPAAAGPAPMVGPSGVVPFNRCPRAAPPPPGPPLRPPELPAPPAAGGTSFGLASLAPLLSAGAMVAVTGDVRFALFAALSPVVALLGAVERRRHLAREARAARRRADADLAAFEAGLAGMVEAEVRRRHDRAPDPAEIARRAEGPSPHLWERVPGAADDFLELRVGQGDVRWEPAVLDSHRLDDDAAAALRRAGTLPGAPVVLGLGGGGVVGIVGDRPAALAVARSLVCQAAVLHGPAHLAVAVCARAEAADDWDWTKWLPHTTEETTGSRLVAGTPSRSRAVLAHLDGQGAEPGRPDAVTLLVVDDDALLDGRDAPARAALRGPARPVAGVVLAGSADRVPACCTHVVTLRADGQASLEVPAAGERVAAFLADGMAPDTARGCALALARFDDPELASAAGSLPTSVRLLPLLGVDPVTAEVVASRWAANGPRCEVPIGLGVDGCAVLDLVRDGPHGLVAGTTGSGKSELLRTLVAGLAATVDPDHLNVVLVDFKGGSAFDECARLPHTVGLVTDLDHHEAERALRCLEAELRHRERVLRAAGAIDLPAYLDAGAPSGPLPRLAVVVDEFATLKAQLPGFVDALVGVAQRGRSLGVHLVLATQRPAGAVSENIRANAGFAVALRVASPSESVDVVGSAAAAAIPRAIAGRAIVRRGLDEAVAVQTAFASAAAPDPSRPSVEVRPFHVGSPAADEPAVEPPPGGAARTDLSALVAAVGQAFRASGRPSPRRPWPDPLPTRVALDPLVPAPAACGSLPPEVRFALADDPDRQRHLAVGWRPGEGNLLLHGMVGAGTTTALASIALALAAATAPGRCHAYVLDMGAGDLAPLAGLPHCGAVIRAADGERRDRLVRRLRQELDRRRSGRAHPEAPAIVLLVDGYPALAGGAPPEILDDLQRVVAGGPEVGLFTILSGDRVASIPSAIGSLVRQKLLFRMADPSEYALARRGTTRVPLLPPGRALDVGSGLLVQVAVPDRPLAAAVAAIARQWPGRTSGPAPVEVLPEIVPLRDVATRTEYVAGTWALAVGRRERDLGVATLEVRPGEHVLVAGPSRSGKTTALAALAATAPGPAVVLAGPRSWLAASSPDPSPTAGIVQAVGAARTLVAEHGRCLLLVDDADALDDVEGALEGLLGSGPPGLVVVAAGRPEALRSAYGHWTRMLRRSRLGLLLRPTAELDGELLGTHLPRRPPVAMVPGRGYLVQGGDAELVQVATTGCAAPP